MLDLRKPGQSLVSTQRKEGDIVEILTGTFRGYTTGAPITMVIWNKDQKSIAYEKLRTEMRPGHSDYPAYMKYKKFNDHRGCLLYTSPSPRDKRQSRMPSSA